MFFNQWVGAVPAADAAAEAFSLDQASAQLPPRVLLVAPHGSYRTVPFLAAAEKLGIDLVIASDARYSLVSTYRDGIRIDPADISGSLKTILHATRQRPFAAVLGCDDASVEFAAVAAETMGLAHNPINAVRLSRRKDLAREKLANAGLRAPRFWLLDLKHSLASQTANITYPCVVKPVSLSASRGVIRANNKAELMAAVTRIQALLAQKKRQPTDESDRILVEQYIDGQEVALEGFLMDGKLHVLAIFDKPDPLIGPYFEETYYITPSRHTAEEQAGVCDAVAAACGAYGLVSGPIHAECRINDNGAWILEVAARTIGGLCGRLLHLSTGHTLEELVLMQAMGERLELSGMKDAAGVLMIPITQGGILRRVEGVIEAKKLQFIEEVIVDVREGYELIPLPEGSSYLGFVFARAPGPAEVEAALRAAHACLRVVIAPMWRGKSADSI